MVWKSFQSGAELLEHLGTLNSAQNGHFMHFSNSCQFGLAIAGGILYSGNFYKVQIFAFFTNLNLQNLFPLTFCHLDYLAKLPLCCFPYKYFHSPQETFINRRQSHSSTLGRFEYHLCIFCVGWLTPTPLCWQALWPSPPSGHTSSLSPSLQVHILTLLCDLLVWLVGLIGEQNIVYTYRKLLLSLIITNYPRSERQPLEDFFLMWAFTTFWLDVEWLLTSKLSFEYCIAGNICGVQISFCAISSWFVCLIFILSVNIYTGKHAHHNVRFAC